MAITRRSVAGLLLVTFALACSAQENLKQDDPCAPNCSGGVEGYFPHPQDCTMYYQCAQGVPILQHCNGGLYFNPIYHVCDFPDHAGCTADPDYDCGGGSNPTATSENPTTSVSVNPTATSEDPTTSVPANPTSTSKNPTTSVSVNPTSTSKNPTTRVSVNPTTEGPLETTSSGSEITDPSDCVPPCPSDEALYPNPRDCSSFFHCAYGIPFLAQCPEGLEYSLELERCDWPYMANCTASDDAPCVAITNPPSLS